MNLLRPRTLTFAALLAATLACTCDSPLGGGGANGRAENEERAPRPKGKAKRGGGGEGAEQPADGEVPMPAGVEYLGDQRWRVQRKAVDRYVEHSEQLGCNAREKGKGYELVGVQVSDDAYALGARNHDVVFTINGMSLDDETDLINVFLALQDAKELKVVLERAGEKRTHVYEIED